jgi:hypothetical protein
MVDARRSSAGAVDSQRHLVLVPGSLPSRPAGRRRSERCRSFPPADPAAYTPTFDFCAHRNHRQRAAFKNHDYIPEFHSIIDETMLVVLSN